MLARPMTLLGQQAQDFQNGDTLALGQSIPATVVTNNIAAVTGQVLLQPFTKRTPTGNSADVLDTAANIIAAIQNATGVQGQLNPGTSWITRIINLAAFTITYSATANTGTTAVANLVVNASSVKDFLVRLVNTTPLRNCQALTTNASAVLSGMSQADLRNLSVGMIVTNAIAGQQGNTIIGINMAAGTLTMSGNSNADNLTIPVNVTFSPVVTFEGIGNMLL